MASGERIIRVLLGCGPLVGQPHPSVWFHTPDISGLLGGYEGRGQWGGGVLELGGGGVNVIKMHCRKFSKS